MGISRNLVGIEFDEDNQLLFTRVNARRVDITSCRDSLNGYQKGRCFYCFKPISLVPGDAELADVDHFIPWAARHEVSNINGVWNLVLACRCCNRGVEGKSARIPDLRLLQRLHTRNEYFIQSKLPLHETIVLQTGQRPEARKKLSSAQLAGRAGQTYPYLETQRGRRGNVLMTLHYYQNHAQDFFDGTVNVDMTPLYEAFTQHLPHGARVLDAGCGSGRDAKAFMRWVIRWMLLMPLPRWWSWRSNIPGYPCS